MHNLIYPRKIGGLCVAVLLAACAKEDERAEDAKPADSAKGAALPSSTSPTASTVTWTDANVLAFLDNTSVADSAAGSMAASKGTSADVKAFGKDMVRDHHAMRKDGQDLARKLSIIPAPKAGDTMTAESAAFQDSLSSMPKGPAWDKTYLDHEVAAHEKVLSAAQSALDATQNADVKALITKAAPKVQEHLDKAKKIQAKLGGAK